MSSIGDSPPENLQRCFSAAPRLPSTSQMETKEIHRTPKAINDKKSKWQCLLDESIYYKVGCPIYSKTHKN